MTIDPILTSLEKKLTASDGAGGDQFGYSASVAGDVIVVGACYDDSRKGSAYVFERNAGGTNAWGQVTKLIASDGATDDQFGYSASVAGDMIVVGACYDDVDANGSQGSAYVYERNAGGTNAWGEGKKLTASDGAANDHFGYSASVAGDVIVVGASGDDDQGESTGSAYVYERNAGGTNTWGQVKKLTASDGTEQDMFGVSASVWGDVIVIGAYQDDDDGSAYVYERNAGGTNAWGQVKKLTASDRAAWDEYGCSVAVAGDVIAVGAYANDDYGESSGSAYVYERNAGGTNAWGQVKKLTASDGATYDWFGRWVSMAGDVLVVGADGDDSNRGSAYVFARNTGGTNAWGQVKKLTIADRAADDHFGISVSVADGMLLIGAYGKDSSKGAAYLIPYQYGEWNEKKKLTASDGAANDSFGIPVSVAGDVAVVGAYEDDLYTGAAYVFERNAGGTNAWGEIKKLTASNGGLDNWFGFSVSVAGDVILVGANNANLPGKAHAGAAYVFEGLLYTTAYDIYPTNSGPLAGGNSITITNGTLGNGSDITNVLVDGVAAQIVTQGTTWVTITLPAAGSAGVKDIVIQSTLVGDTTLAGAYTYNPAGWIGITVNEGGTQWEEVAGLSAWRQYPAASELNGALYAVGGDDSGTARTNMYRYNGTNWTQVAGLPAARSGLAVGTLNGSLYAVGGNNSGAKTNVYRYDGTNWAEVAGLPEARSGLAVGTLNGALYAIGGNNSGVKTNVYRFDGTSWTEVAGLPVARYDLAAGVFDGSLYAFGGQWTNDVSQTNVYRFDGENWTEVVGLPRPIHGMGAGVLNGYLYSISGISEGDSITNVYRYRCMTVASGVSPSSGSCTGGYPVTISGTNLCGGSDVTNVTLCGVPAVVVTKSATQVVVTAGQASAGSLGDVRVFSTSFGETVKSNAFTYIEDSDSDGMPDSWEVQYGLNPANAADALAHGDSDGMNNLSEYIAGTDPTNGASVLAIQNIRVAGMVIEWPSVSGRVYGVLYVTNLPTEGFQVLGTASNLLATPDMNCYTNTTLTNVPVLLYRVKVRRE